MTHFLGRKSKCRTLTEVPSDQLLDIYPGGNRGLQLHLDWILCGYWEISPALSGYAPFTPHYNQLFHPSLVSLLVTSDPTVEYYWKVQCYLRGRTLRLLGHEHFLSFDSPCGQNPLTHIYAYLKKKNMVCMMHI
jgi:hypothetical protein